MPMPIPICQCRYFQMAFLFSQMKHLEVKKVILKVGNKNITNDAKLCEAFNMYFSNVVASLNIPGVNNVNIYITAKENAKKYPPQIKCFELHSSIMTINKQCLGSTFNFQRTNANEVMKIINHLNRVKICQNADALAKNIKLQDTLKAHFC